MCQGIKEGISFVTSGIQYFLQHKELWKYALLPLILVCVIYGLLIAGGLYFANGLTDCIQEWCRASLPSWLQWLYNVSSFLIYLGILLLTGFLIVITASSVYEIAGGPFLDAMLEKLEATEYGLTPVKKSLRFDIFFAVSMFFHTINTLMLTILIWLITLFFPYITLPLSMLILGKRFGISYLAIAGYCRGMTLRETKTLASQKPSLIQGYGMIIFLLLMFVPVLAPIILPGIIIGGTFIFHDLQKRKER